MRAPVGPSSLSRVLVMTLLCAGCPHQQVVQPVAETPRRPTFTASRVRSFTDSYAITAIADTPSTLWAGSPRGLIRWDAGRWSVMTQKDGLPADRVVGLATDAAGTVWVATSKGLSRGLHGAWTNYGPAPVGSFLTGLVPGGSDGKSMWAGGPEGLARLQKGRWDHYFADSGITTLAADSTGAIWVGTSGNGVLRVSKSGDKIERFGANQGCEIDVVRGMVAVNKTLFAVGEGPGGARAAYYDGERFYSYELQSASVIEWAARAGASTLLGAGDHVYELGQQPPDAQATTAPVKLKPIPSWTVPARAVALKADTLSSALEDPPNAPKPHAPPAAANNKGGPVLPPTGPPLTVGDAAWTLPDGVTTVAGSERGLLVGTRFFGAVRVENGVSRRFQTQDLAQGATRLTVACGKGSDECFLATGSTRAWRFDGQAFEVAPVDPEPGSRVLAVLLDPQGDVLAIHRGAQENDRQLRLSRVSDGRWTPVGIQAVEVPEGAPELDFAEFAPDGHLWVGLRYIDREHDVRDYGAHEIALDSGKVIRHEELPTDVVAMYWKSRSEAWFATRSGAARLLDGKVRVFTEIDGMESDIARDIGPGPGGTILVATGRGTGRYDGVRWTFPHLGPFYPPANSLAHDSSSNAFVGTVRGLYCIGDCNGDPIDKKRGLLDDDVHDVVVDRRNRVWVLTDKGINVVDP